ncbi:(S)-mandelate dehydrogenase, mitochondrial [Vanrija pseudolonga]|uniref:(S)-mandelate dehydrogenase, mitochondrial n=1 Tax=Vanrija pseudolonga TaxID=143232 RepID=A0AAF0XZU7_9TREE|nr:(S)-mandelate dehydrogenase, mitochondrial [Vanrija pseudolonga]
MTLTLARPLARAALRTARSVPVRASSTSSAAPRAVPRTARLLAAAALGAGATFLALSEPAAAEAPPHAKASAGSIATGGKISLAQLAKHSHSKSLWIAIDGKVYDVTDFLDRHPGGSKILAENGGKDVSKLFHSIHPPTTFDKYIRPDQYVGQLDEESLYTLSKETSEEEQRIQATRDAMFGINSVVSLSDLERLAEAVVPRHAWAYYSTGADTEAALGENANAFKRVYFRPRTMRDVSNTDTSTTVLGVKSSIPVYISPTARNGMGHPEVGVRSVTALTSQGEAAVARGAGEAGILQVLSHFASKSLDEVKAAAKDGQQVGYQLYLQPDREQSAEAVREAVKNGAHSIWLTVDTTIVGGALCIIRKSEAHLMQLGKRETERRILAQELSPAPHGQPLNRAPLDYGMSEPKMTWDDIAWIRSLAPGLPVVIKGIGAWEDVVLAYQKGADAVVLSNHGGRQLDFAQPPLKTLYDVHQHAPDTLHQPNFSVFLDGGIRHGTDVLKALCLGAKAVGLGRPAIHAVSAYGSEGVEKMIMILQEEIDIGMKLLGVTSVDQLGPEYLDTSKL